MVFVMLLCETDLFPNKHIYVKLYLTTNLVEIPKLSLGVVNFLRHKLCLQCNIYANYTSGDKRCMCVCLSECEVWW